MLSHDGLVVGLSPGRFSVCSTAKVPGSGHAAGSGRDHSSFPHAGHIDRHQRPVDPVRLRAAAREHEGYQSPPTFFSSAGPYRTGRHYTSRIGTRFRPRRSGWLTEAGESREGTYLFGRRPRISTARRRSSQSRSINDLRFTHRFRGQFRGAEGAPLGACGPSHPGLKSCAILFRLCPA